MRRLLAILWMWTVWGSAIVAMRAAKRMGQRTMSTWHPDSSMDAAIMRRVLREAIHRTQTLHSPADARPRLERCVRAEEQELGREQVRDELREMLREIDESWPK